MKGKSVIRILGIALIFQTSTAVATTLDFNNLGHGGIASTGPAQYYQDGVSIGVNSFDNGDHFDLAIGFDTNVHSPIDQDLQGPYHSGNLDPHTDFGTVLIIADRDVRHGHHPDDEEDGGLLSFYFDTDVSEIYFDLIDIDWDSDEAEDTRIGLYNNGHFVQQIRLTDFLHHSSPFYIPGVHFGNNSANHLGFAGIIFDQINFRFSDSAAIDNISFTAVPEPASAGLLLSGLAGVVAARRRKKIS